MLHINLAAFEGMPFVKMDPNVTYECIGYGQSPADGANYVVGTRWDQASNRSVVTTFLLKDVTFIGKISLAKAP